MTREDAIFGTPSKDMALAFAGKWGDKDIKHTSNSGKGKLRQVLEELRPGVFEEVFGKREGYIHEMAGQGFHKLPGREDEHELISREKEIPKNVERVKDLLKALEASKNTKLVRYKQARDEIVKLTYHKSAKLPYRQRSEVLAYDSETKEIVCRIKKSKAGGLYVELPGGGIDKGESPLKAVKREALEEAGITLKNIEQVSTCRWKWPKGHQGAMGTWADLYAGDANFIFIAEVDTKGKPTSQEGDGWDKLVTKSPDKLRDFLKSHKANGLMIMQDCRLAALKKLEARINT